ncbi:MAG TPA: TIGR04283 family arsenosugar biosynthesis glycosyltransferase [Candidatus Binatia bacterium]|nr:TIGR04283 family arsenosugar biosynthesis glycosyltransferase [Candidatus Binatia bacterium]
MQSRCVSVIIPALNEARNIAQTLTQVRQAGESQLVVVDGDSSDGTPEIARSYADLVLSAPRGRARQMNVGARAATGEVLLFLHADTVLPRGFPGMLAQALADPEVVGGRFDVRLDTPGYLFRVIETLMNLRSRWTRISTGDQAIFVRRETFLAVGGYPEIDLMEDLALSRKLKQAGNIACLRARVVTSARRWQQNGVLRTVVLMWTLRLAHFLGVPPARLKVFYRDTR